jgi:dihydroflavonol-4-reductase
MSNEKVLVLGASGFLGSHVVKALCAAQRDVRVMVRASSDTTTIDGLPVERCIGDVLDSDSLRAAMTGCHAVYYCVVDTRAWLRDVTPLRRVNIDGLRNVLDIAMDLPLRKFVYTSTIATIGLNASGVASERDAFNWADRAPDYVTLRVQAEQEFFDYCRRGLPGVVCCVGTTYGACDQQPTPHGRLIELLVQRKMPVYFEAGLSVVGIEDAAAAMLLAEQHGSVGQRYIISDRYMTLKELATMAADIAGVNPPPVYVPHWLMYSGCWLAEIINGVLDKDTELTRKSLRLSNIMKDYDNSKARNELHWQPRPFEQSVEEAVRWFQHKVGVNP